MASQIRRNGAAVACDPMINAGCSMPISILQEICDLARLHDLNKSRIIRGILARGIEEIKKLRDRRSVLGLVLETNGRDPLVSCSFSAPMSLFLALDPIRESCKLRKSSVVRTVLRVGLDAYRDEMAEKAKADEGDLEKLRSEMEAEKAEAALKDRESDHQDADAVQAESDASEFDTAAAEDGLIKKQKSKTQKSKKQKSKPTKKGRV